MTKSDAKTKAGSESSQMLLTACLCGTSIWLTAPISSTAAYLYAGVFTSVTFLAPAVLVWAQRYKKYALPAGNLFSLMIKFEYSEIRGTWDPAVPKVNKVDTIIL